MNRLGIFLFYDGDGIVSPHVHRLIEAFSPHMSEILFVVNGEIDMKSYAGLERFVTEILLRDNSGYDVWGYKAGVEHVGYERLVKFDEVVLFNYTFFAPTGDLGLMFRTMEARDVNGWGLTAYGDSQKTFLQSYFLVTRRSLHGTQDYRDYWDTMPMIKSINDSLEFHEFRFSRHFTSLDYKLVPYLPNRPDWDGNTTLTDIRGLYEDGMPVVKYRAFNFDPDTIEARGGRRIASNYAFLDEGGIYPVEEIWSYIIRQTSPDDLIAASESLRVVGTKRPGESELVDCRGSNPADPWIFVTLEDRATLDMAFSRLAAFPAESVFIATGDPAIAARAQSVGIATQAAGSERFALPVFQEMVQRTKREKRDVIQLSDFAQERERYFFKSSLFEAYWDPLLSRDARAWLKTHTHIGLAFPLPNAVTGTSYFNRGTQTSMPNWKKGYRPKWLRQATGQIYWPWRGNMLIRDTLASSKVFMTQVAALVRNVEPREREILAGAEAAIPELARHCGFASGILVPETDVAKLVLRSDLRARQAGRKISDLTASFRADVKALQASVALASVAEPAQQINPDAPNGHEYWQHKDGITLSTSKGEFSYASSLNLRYNFEDWLVGAGAVRTSGWMFDFEAPHQILKVALLDETRIVRQPTSFTQIRKDVAEVFSQLPIEERCGFCLEYYSDEEQKATRYSLMFINEATGKAALIPMTALAPASVAA